MKIDDVIPFVEKQLTTKRFKHSLRVVDQALELAYKFDGDLENVGLAAILHDYAKDLPVDKLRQLMMDSTLPKDLLTFHHELWHGPVASLLIQREFGITDVDIQHAIRYHTTGRSQMSQLELIIYVADYIEPGRSFPGVEEVRQMAQVDLVHAAWLATRNTMQFLMQRKAQIYSDTNEAYNDLTQRAFHANKEI